MKEWQEELNEKIDTTLIALKKLEAFKEAIPYLEPEMVRTASHNFLESIKEALQLKELLEQQKSATEQLLQQVTESNKQQQEANTLTTQLHVDLQSVLDILRRTKDREQQTLDKLDKYLDTWV